MKRGKDDGYSNADLVNHANQLNANNDAYWQGRGYDERPDDCESRSSDDSPGRK